MGGRPYRVATDGVLETAVPLMGLPEARWVPVIPCGEAGGPWRGETWRRWIFSCVHSGPFGGHRDGPKTSELMTRTAWWDGMDHDVEVWVDRCWQCLQYRRRVQKGHCAAQGLVA